MPTARDSRRHTAVDCRAPRPALRTRFLPLLAIAAAAAPLPASPLFEEHSALSVELSGPVGALVGRKQHREELQFALRVDGIDHDIRVRVRGNSRLRVCSFPPLRLDFGAAETEGTLFEGQDKLKVVTTCRSGRNAQFDVLEEYAAYRIFNSLSEASYRVRLLQLTMSDTASRTREARPAMSAFLIESRAELTARLASTEASLPGVSVEWLDDTQAALVYVFQYLIGNTDWSLVTATGTPSCCHNGTLIGQRPDVLLVPYDFDLSGLVNASYAQPDASLGIRSVKTRVYRGFCVPRPELEAALDRVRARQADILRIVAELPDVSDGDRKHALRYLNRFFDDAGDTDRLLSNFEKRCLD